MCSRRRHILEKFDVLDDLRVANWIFEAVEPTGEHLEGSSLKRPKNSTKYDPVGDEFDSERAAMMQCAEHSQQQVGTVAQYSKRGTAKRCFGQASSRKRVYGRLTREWHWEGKDFAGSRRSEKANGDQIKKSYRKLAKKYHPDANRGDARAADRFKEVGEAYSVLST